MTRRRVHDVLDGLMLLVVVAAVVVLWPSSLGGSIRFIVVEGHSMEPTFHFGDLVVTRDNPHPRVGDVIVYRIPESDPAAGMMIIHRVNSIRPDGTYQTQGDNRTTSDPFNIAGHDIVGSPVTALPHFGRVIGLTSSPLVLGMAAGILTTLLLWPRRTHHRRVAVAEPREEPVGGTDFEEQARLWLEEQLRDHDRLVAH